MSADLFSNVGGRRPVHGGWYEYHPDFVRLDRGLDLWPQLRDGLDWKQFHRTIRTKTGDTFQVAHPRLECWYVDGAPRTYRYGGTEHPSSPLPAVLRPLLDAVNAEGGTYNAVFCNLYRSGQDSIGWHADDEPVLGDVRESQIATLSFGATRRFELRRAVSDDRPAGPKLSIDLEHGSLFVMGPGLQAGWLHQLPKQPEVLEPRISLTFRRVQ